MMCDVFLYLINKFVRMTVENFSFAPFNRAYQQHQDKLILLIVVLLSLYLIAFLAELTWRLIDNSQQPSTQLVTLTATQPNTNNSSPTINTSALKRAKLFGDVQQVVAPVQQVQEVTEAPETKLNLTLTGVVSSSDETQGAAIIEKNNVQVTYGIGEKIEDTNATLDKIYIDRVIIKNRLVRETLMLDGIDFDEANSQNNRTQGNTGRATVLTSSGSGQNNSIGPRKVTANSEIQKMRESMTESPTSFADFISIQPHSPQGQLIGYQVSPGKQPELFTQIGLRSGDIITQINGLDLSDIQQSIEAIEVLKESQSLQMDIIRSGEPMSLDIDMPTPEDV